MIITSEVLPFIKDYIDDLNKCLKDVGTGSSLTKLQIIWLRFVLMGLLVTNSLCWERFERAGLGEYKASAMCWMFRRAKIAWEILLQASVLYILKLYKIKSGTLVVDDTDNERSKNTTKIAKVHKIKNKKTGGFFNGQNIVFLLLVSDRLTIPVGFKFYEPDPAQRAWRMKNALLLKKGVTKKYRPTKPERDPAYPDKKELAIKLIEEFTTQHHEIKIRAVTADAFYGKLHFMQRASDLTNLSQVISQIAKTQLVNVNGRYISVGKFFENYNGKTEEVLLRNNIKKISYCSAKFKIKSHGKKYFIVALKYEGEKEFRYLIASDMTWRDIDIIKAYAARWLVEVFFQDWKSYEGWSNLAKQRDFIGSDRGLTLSLLCDHMMHIHNSQLISFKNKEQALTVGSLRQKILMESLIAFIERIVNSDHSQALLTEVTNKISDLFQVRTSSKHFRTFSDNDEVCMN
jgi:hypothetical protein